MWTRADFRGDSRPVFCGQLIVRAFDTHGRVQGSGTASRERTGRPHARHASECDVRVAADSIPAQVGSNMVKRSKGRPRSAWLLSPLVFRNSQCTSTSLAADPVGPGHALEAELTPASSYSVEAAQRHRISPVSQGWSQSAWLLPPIVFRHSSCTSVADHSANAVWT